MLTQVPASGGSKYFQASIASRHSLRQTVAKQNKDHQRMMGDPSLLID